MSSVKTLDSVQLITIMSALVKLCIISDNKYLELVDAILDRT